jgi:hypothetical protein
MKLLDLNIVPSYLDKITVKYRIHESSITGGRPSVKFRQELDNAFNKYRKNKLVRCNICDILIIFSNNYLSKYNNRMLCFFSEILNLIIRKISRLI